ncbi:hypothetical protein CYD30_25180, partial [Kosakonia cowanii]
MTGTDLLPRRRRPALLAALVLLLTVTGGLVWYAGLTPAGPAGKNQPAGTVTEMTGAVLPPPPEEKNSVTAAADLQHTASGADEEEPDRPGNQPAETAGETEGLAPTGKTPGPEDDITPPQAQTDTPPLSGKGVVTSPAPDSAQTPRPPEVVRPATSSTPVVKKHSKPAVKVKRDNPPVSLPAAADGSDDAQSRKIAAVVSRTG